ncbi:Exo84p [Malassezia vespertilionis]|uniref:Exocyst complex component EXO84 n=1 Tax=Malassezia vespertilionis TaxID=2020962 RepID=A0A2N1J977_9BASI|nr:Exo84p [Malassezia vespertilionis]
MTGVTEEEEHEANGVSSAAPALSYFGIVSTQLQQQSESGLRGVNESLSRIQDETQKQLKTQVFKNYAEFITISKEIATLENDMLEFKDLLSEWKQLPQQLKIEDPLREFGIGSLKGNRSSLVDLEQIYKAQIAALWENIEGSQKFVPYAPNRHLIAETSQFIELNAATYKPKQAVALFLLDSLLLIAVQRRKHYGSQVHLVAERAFGLSEIVVVDLKDTKDLKNALKIKRGKEVYVYRTEQVQEKRTLLNAFRRVGEDLANKMKLERKSRDSVKRIGEGSISDALGLPEDVSAKKTDADMQTLGPWLNTVIDDLAVHIALREWEAAVSLIEDGKKRLANRPVSEGPLYLLVENFNVCANELVGAISAELGSPYQCKSIMVRDANLLLRLDKGREARDLLLSARSELLRRRTRQIKYEGDVSLYISELAMLYFTLIKNTGDWYMTAFKDYKMASGFVQWASDQVRSYGETFRRQVYGVDQDPDVVKEAKEITMNCAQILNDVGLNLAFMLMELLQPSEHHNDFPILSLSVAEAEAQAHRRRLEQQLQASEQ